MAIFPFANGSPKEMTDGKVKVGGVWKQDSAVFTKVNGQWHEVWSGLTIIEALVNNYTLYHEVDGATDINDDITFHGVVVRCYDADGVILAEERIDDFALDSRGFDIWIFRSDSPTTQAGVIRANVDVNGKVFLYFSLYDDTSSMTFAYKSVTVTKS